MSDDPVTIVPTDNGAYHVRGPVKIVDPDGNEWDLSRKKVVALCRCGQSATKPFCDGSHMVAGFEATHRAGDGLEG